MLSSDEKNALAGSIAEYERKFSAWIEGVDRDALVERVRSIRKDGVENREELWLAAKSALEKNGVRVHEARTKADAQRVFSEVTDGCKKAVKAKTNTFEELGLRFTGEVTETDIGEWLVKEMKLRRIHPTGPAIHVTPQTISKHFASKGIHVPADAEAITHHIRKLIRAKILDADLGITGANFITSEGAVALVENEGNISLVSRLPGKHVIIAGKDKLVRTAEDAAFLWKVVSAFATGEPSTSYLSFIAAPSRTADIQKKNVCGVSGACEVHLIIVGDGRDELAKEFPEAAYCIGCGACMLNCPVFRNQGYDFGYKYLNGIGITFTAFMESLKLAAERGLYDCAVCKGCKRACPAGIDVTGIIRSLRARAAGDGLSSAGTQEMISNVREHGNPFGALAEGEVPKTLYCC
ncbi:MAG: lactate utilization protein [Candidatus Diapherotrites archaeon]|nr:lactate utilization protein [Candidatus Diapherotrites archaeon]